MLGMTSGCVVSKQLGLNLRWARMRESYFEAAWYQSSEFRFSMSVSMITCHAPVSSGHQLARRTVKTSSPLSSRLRPLGSRDSASCVQPSPAVSGQPGRASDAEPP